MSPSAVTTSAITTWRSTRGRSGRGGPGWSQPPRSPSPTSDGWEKKFWQVGVGCHITLHLWLTLTQFLKHFTFCFLRQPQASAESLPGGPGCLPQSQSVATKISACDPTTTPTHHGVNITTPLNLPQLRHVTQSIPGEILDNRPRPTGKLDF